MREARCRLVSRAVCERAIQTIEQAFETGASSTNCRDFLEFEGPEVVLSTARWASTANSPIDDMKILLTSADTHSPASA